MWLVVIFDEFSSSKHPHNQHPDQETEITSTPEAPAPFTSYPLSRTIQNCNTCQPMIVGANSNAILGCSEKGNFSTNSSTANIGCEDSIAVDQFNSATVWLWKQHGSLSS